MGFNSAFKGLTKLIQSHALVRTTTGMSPVFDNLHIISYRIQIMKFSVLFQYPLQHVSSNSPIPRLTYYITRCIINPLNTELNPICQ